MMSKSSKIKSYLDYTTLPQPKSSKGPLMAQDKPYVHGQDNYKAKGYEPTKWSFEEERKGWKMLKESFKQKDLVKVDGDTGRIESIDGDTVNVYIFKEKKTVPVNFKDIEKIKRCVGQCDKKIVDVDGDRKIKCLGCGRTWN